MYKGFGDKFMFPDFEDEWIGDEEKDVTVDFETILRKFIEFLKSSEEGKQELISILLRDEEIHKWYNDNYNTEI